MPEISRKEARRLLFALLFETEFKSEETPEAIYNSALEDRNIPEDEYIKSVFFGICQKSAELDAIISKYAKGWRADRLSKVSRSILRIAIYEMLFVEDIDGPDAKIARLFIVTKFGRTKDTKSECFSHPAQSTGKYFLVYFYLTGCILLAIVAGVGNCPHGRVVKIL